MYKCEKGFVILDSNKCAFDFFVCIPIYDCFVFATFGCCHPCFLIFIVNLNTKINVMFCLWQHAKKTQYNYMSRLTRSIVMYRKGIKTEFLRTFIIRTDIPPTPFSSNSKMQGRGEVIFVFYLTLDKIRLGYIGY